MENSAVIEGLVGQANGVMSEEPLHPQQILLTTDAGNPNNNASPLKFPRLPQLPADTPKLIVRPIPPHLATKDYFKPPSGAVRRSDDDEDDSSPRIWSPASKMEHHDSGISVDSSSYLTETTNTKPVDNGPTKPVSNGYLSVQDRNFQPAVLPTGKKKLATVGSTRYKIDPTLPFQNKKSHDQSGGQQIPPSKPGEKHLNVNKDLSALLNKYKGITLQHRNEKSTSSDEADEQNEPLNKEDTSPRPTPTAPTVYVTKTAGTPSSSSNAGTASVRPVIAQSPVHETVPFERVSREAAPLQHASNGPVLYENESNRAVPYQNESDSAVPYQSTSNGAFPYQNKSNLVDPYQNTSNGTVPYQNDSDVAPSPHTDADRVQSKNMGDGAVRSKNPSDSPSNPVSNGAVLSKLIDMIHDEFAFDGYLEDGVEDVHMAEFVQSLSGLSEEMFRESITDQFSDLYWDEDLLHQMYQVVQKRIMDLKENRAGRLDHSLSPSSVNNQSPGSQGRPPGSTTTQRNKDTPENNVRNMSGMKPQTVKVSTKEAVAGSQVNHRWSETDTKRPSPANRRHSSPISGAGNALENSLDCSLDLSGLSGSLDFNSSADSRRGSLTPRESFTSSDVTSNDSGIHYTGSTTSRSSSDHSSSDRYSWGNSDYTEVLPLKTTTNKDLLNDVAYIYERYQEYMALKLSSSVDEVMENLGAKIKELEQQIILEKRTKKKNKMSIYKLMNSENPRAKELLIKLTNDQEESDRKIMFLKQTKRQLKNVYAERFGLDPTLLHSFIENFNRGNIAPLSPQRKSSHLSFSPLWDKQAEDVEDYSDFTRGSTLINASVPGLCAYLFARHAKTQGYVRYFLCTYRYCTTPEELLGFIADKFTAAVTLNEVGQRTSEQVQMQYRAMDILGEWIDLTYERDFLPNPELQYRLIELIKEKIIPTDRTNQGYKLLQMVNIRQRSDFSVDEDDVESGLNKILETSLMSKPRQAQGSQGSTPSSKTPASPSVKNMQCFGRKKDDKDIGEAVAYKLNMMIAGISFTDHTSRVIAEQLTCIQQDFLHRLTPFHLLNSRALGAGVARQSPSKSSEAMRQNMFGFNAGFRSTNEDSSPGNTETSLFVGSYQSDGLLEMLLAHDQDMSTWISAEICICPSVKSQLALISRLISIASYCHELRNYATFVQILDALETFVIKQLPVWRHVPAKTLELLEGLNKVKVMLKTDHTCLVRDGVHTEKATIPPLLYYLMHVQQLELGGFTLANGMFKWNKMRSIAKMVDQIHMFKQVKYSLIRNPEVQEGIKLRLQAMKYQDLQTLAAENPANTYYSQRGKAGKFRSTLRKVKTTLSGNDS